MAKVQSNNVGKNVWFAAKILKFRPSTTFSDTLDVNICYDDDGQKEWVPQNCVAPLITDDSPSPAIEQFKAGTQALGYRRKPGSNTGWWYSVKVLRYLPDVPGAFVQWRNFPFPDSILEVGQIFPATFPSSPALEEPLKEGSRKRGADGEDTAGESSAAGKKAKTSGSDEEQSAQGEEGPV
jgi:hypothetical protein